MRVLLDFIANPILAQVLRIKRRLENSAMNATQFPLFVSTTWIIIFTSFYSAHSQTWVQCSAPSNNWWSVACSADGKIIVAGTANGGDQTIYTSTNSGAAWVSNNVPKSYWSSVTSSADGKILAAAAITGASGLYVSTNSGVTWAQTFNAINSWTSIAASADGSKLVAVAQGGVIATSTNSGDMWTQQAGAPSYEWGSVASSADGTRLVAAVINGGRIYTSADSGLTWVSRNVYDQQWQSVASSADGTRLAAVSLYGSIYVSTNSGGAWASNGIPVGFALHSVAVSSDGSKLVAAASLFPNQFGGPLYISTNSGATWIPAEAPTNYWRAVASSADGNKLVAVLPNGSIWISQSTPVPSMNIQPATSTFKLSWLVPSTNFILQQSADLNSWTDVTNLPVLNPTNLHNQVTLPFFSGKDFFRLKSP